MGLRLCLLGALALAACTVKTDPDQGSFSCSTSLDCGDGYDCKPQFAGGARCFKKGTCTDGELCNGKDDNCDGQTDESFPDAGAACASAGLGVCGPGVLVCTTGAVSCRSNLTPVAETCNQRDDNCNGATDEGFDLQRDDAHCGTCTRACQAGTGCTQGTCRERNCANGLDDDGDGRIDCLDEDCQGLACAGGDGGLNCGTPVDSSVQDAGPVDAGADDAGADAGAPDAGSSDAGPSDAGPSDAGFTAGVCLPRELTCDNGADDDGDGRADCADSDCDGRTCANGMRCAAGVCPPVG
jgi:hypothetical protein